MESIEDKILKKIQKSGKGWSFSKADFSTLGSQQAIYLALHRLEKKSAIRRVLRGIYDYPRYSELLQKEMGPDIHRLAGALARKFGWRIQPSGPAALNLIGLSTQIPSRFIYQSDGPSRQYSIGRTQLEFKHSALKDFGFRCEESGIVVQALKALGEKQITEEIINRIREWLPKEKRSVIIKDTRRVTGWVYDTIKLICRETNNG